ncbi:MAG: hypothetical protein ACJAXX_002318 [Roseivirga sp.]
MPKPILVSNLIRLQAMEKVSSLTASVNLNTLQGTVYWREISFENLTLKKMNNDLEITNITETKITPIITLGWDIRPSIKGY